MKSTITIILFLMFCQFCLASKFKKLPEEPWRYIVELDNKHRIFKWGYNDVVHVKLFGYHTEKDSLMVVNSINVLNELCETVYLQITTFDKGNLDIYFLDDNKDTYYESFQYKFGGIHTIHTKKGRIIVGDQLFFTMENLPDSVRQNYITNKMAFALFPHEVKNNMGKKILEEVDRKARNGDLSIFLHKGSKDLNPYFSELSIFDKKVIKAAYLKNFDKILPLAKRQFGGLKFPIWFYHNTFPVLFFPFILIILIFGGLIVVLYNKVFSRINNEWLKFNITSLISLLVIWVLFSIFLTILYTIQREQINLILLLTRFLDSASVIPLLGLPILNAIWLIEIVVKRSLLHKYFKILLLFLISFFIPSSIFSIYLFFKKGIHSVSDIIAIFLLFIIIGIIRALISFFILKEKEIKIENELKLSALRELKTRAELNALHSKINPHFLYNSLNSIAGLAKTNADKTEHMALSLSKLFRYSINKEQSDWSTLAEELEMVNVYLDIEKVRFDDRLEFSIDLPEELKAVRIPQFLIQPLAENALKHGISKLVSKGIVKITVRKVDQWIEIEVADNGPGFPNELNPGFGLQSIYDKLEILYPDRFELHFLNSPNKLILIKLA